MNEIILYKKDSEITNKKAVAAFFNSLSDGKFLLTAKNIRKRTLKQNDYYWGCLVPMVKDGLRNAGYNDIKENEDAHEVLKHLFLKKKIVNHETGEVITEIAGSTANLKTVDFNLFLEDIWQWADEFLNLYIPKPNEAIPIFDKHYENDLQV